MTTSEKNVRTCNKGHTYYKSSDCPTCPTCEQERRPVNGFLIIALGTSKTSIRK